MTTPSTPEGLVTGRLSRVTHAAAGQQDVDGGSLGRGDQVGGPLLEDHLVTPVQPAPGQSAPGKLAQLPVARRIAGRRTVPGVEIRLEQGAFPRRTLLQQPSFDGTGGLADHEVQGRVRIGGRITEAEHAYDASAERVPDGNGRTRIGLGAFGEMLGAVDVDQLPFRERQTDSVGARELLGEHETRDTLDRGQLPDLGGFAETALQHGAASIGEGHIHGSAREPVLQPVQYGCGGADEPPVQIEILEVGKLAAFR